jgi:radical SAM protein with 4Fe4S-binding SPASM domain
MSFEKAARLKSIGMGEPINRITGEIQLSLGGPNSRVADQMAGSAGFYEKAIDSIRNLRAEGLNFRVKSVVTHFNAPYIQEWLVQMAQMGVERVACAGYGRSFYRHKDEYFLSNEDHVMLRGVFDRFEEEYPDVELILTSFEAPETPGENGGNSGEEGSPPEQERITEHLRRKEEAWEGRAHCSGGTSSMTITPDGKVILCDQVPQNGVFVVGDFSRQSIVEVWNSDEIKRFTEPPMEKFEGTVCFDCEDYISCHQEYGYCFRDSFFNYGTIYAPPPNCPKAPDDGLRVS